MRNLKIFGITLLLMSLAIVPAYAKGHGSDSPFDDGDDKTGRLAQLQQALDLTSQQEADIKKIIFESREETGLLREASQASRNEIRNILGGEVLDEPRLRELVREQAERHANLLVARHATQAKINQILTPEQQEKKEALRQHRLEHKGLRRGAGLVTSRADMSPA